MAPIPALQPAPPAATQPAVLDQLQLQELVASGQTLTLGQTNARLGIFEISAATADAVGVQTVEDRGAVHMPATSFAAFCDGLIAPYRRRARQLPNPAMSLRSVFLGS
jgi:hypothetical protein